MVLSKCLARPIVLNIFLVPYEEKDSHSDCPFFLIELWFLAVLRRHFTVSSEMLIGSSNGAGPMCGCS